MPFEFRFTHTPLKNELHLLRIDQSPELTKALKRDLTKLFWNDLTYRFSHDRNANISIFGEQGSGKSTGAQIIKCYADRFFELPSRIDDILFTRKQFLTRFKKSTLGQTYIIDEDFDYITQIGAFRVREALRYVEQTIRASQNNLISCAVSETPHLYNYVLEAFDIDYSRHLNRFILYDRTQFGFHPVGFILLDATTIPKALSVTYSAHKKAFLEKVKAQSHRNIYMEMEKLSIDVLDSLKSFRGKLSKGFLKVHCRKLFPEMAETELMELTEVCMYQDAMKKLGGLENSKVLRGNEK